MALKGAGKNSTEEVIKGHLKHFQLANMDLSGDPLYFGYLHPDNCAEDGPWYIKRMNLTTGVVDYCQGTTGYNDGDDAWTNRVSQTYGAFDAIF